LPLRLIISHYTLLKPFFSLASNIIATVAGIVLSFPFTPKGILYMVGSIINTFMLWLYDKVADVTEKTFPATSEWTGDRDSDLPGELVVSNMPQLKLIARFVWKTMQRVTSQAKVLEKNVETRAKGYGVPVDEYKTKVTDVANEAIAKGQNAFEKLRTQAQQGGKVAQKKGEWSSVQLDTTRG
jgi:hypothetical protein